MRIMKLNEYICLTYTMDNGDVDLVAGIVVGVDSDSITVDDEGTFGRITQKRIKLAQISDIFDKTA